MAHTPIVGQRFSKLKVISEEIRVNKSGRLFNVKCDCGWIGYKTAKHMIAGRCKSCKSCSAKETSKKYPMPIRSEYVGSLGKTYYSTLKQGAKRRNLCFDVSQEYLWKLFIDQKGICAISGYPIILSTITRKSNPDYSKFTASLDRIDSSIGYVVGNIQWVHKDINRLKNNFNQVDFIEMCIHIADYQRDANQQPSTSGMV